MRNIVIQAEKLGKLYQIGHREQYYTLRDILTNTLTAPFRRIKSWATGGNSGRGNNADDHIWALQDVSFAIQHGEVVGIIGHNGAGKSTLLKILSRITEPTCGFARIKGRVGSLLEVGTGFHPELTGRENIYLNGAILGMKKTDIVRKFDEIVAFAEVEKFVDTPVKRYSSGMFVRLAFAVAAHLEPEILMVDEVLAVGDAAFQKKCLNKMDNVARTGRTVLFVSHNMGAIRGLCQRVICLSQGRIANDGDAQRVVASYLHQISEGFLQKRPTAQEPLVIERVVLKNSRGEKTISFVPGEDLIVELHFATRGRIAQPYVWIAIMSPHGPVCSANMLLDGHRPDHLEGRGVISCTFKAIPLLPQMYTLQMGVRAEDGVTLLTDSKDIGSFNVVGKMEDIGFHGELADAISWHATPLIIPYEWQLPEQPAVAVAIHSPEDSPEAQ